MGVWGPKAPAHLAQSPWLIFRPTLGPGSGNFLPSGLSLWSGLLWLFPLGVRIWIYIDIYISTLFKDSFLHRLYKVCTHLPLRSEITSLQILLLCPQTNGFPVVPWACILPAEGIGPGSAGSSWVGDLVMNPSTHCSCEGLRSSSRSSGERLSRLEQRLCSHACSIVLSDLTGSNITSLKISRHWQQSIKPSTLSRLSTPCLHTHKAGLAPGLNDLP